MRYKILVVAVAGKNPITGEFQPEQSEVVTVQAESLQHARNLVPVYMKMRVQGQELKFFRNGVQI